MVADVPSPSPYLSHSAARRQVGGTVRRSLEVATGRAGLVRPRRYRRAMARSRRRTPVPKAKGLAQYVRRQIRTLRLERGLSQAALGGRFLTRAAISSLERGVSAPSLHVLGYLARRLGVKPKDFFPPD
jgi:ribosome-binding protein aMBF1 (putative translation factor)